MNAASVKEVNTASFWVVWTPRDSCCALGKGFIHAGPSRSTYWQDVGVTIRHRAITIPNAYEQILDFCPIGCYFPKVSLISIPKNAFISFFFMTYTGFLAVIFDFRSSITFCPFSTYAKSAM